MFHLLIVEDEKRTREGLCRHIDWKSIGVDPVTAVAGGMEALLAIDTIKPDILLSDIRMPHMTGIELASIIRKRYPKCKIIFLSGYADKEYLMSAIELKAVNYIEKPVDAVEIGKAVEKAVQQLESEQQEELIHVGFQKTLPLIHEEIVSALISPDFDWERFSRDYVPLYFQWNKIGTYRLACIRTAKKLSGEAQMKELVSLVIKYLENVPKLLPDNCFVSSLSSQEIVAIFRTSLPSAVPSVLKELQEVILERHFLETTIGISASCLSLSGISDLYSITAHRAEYESFYNQRHCFFDGCEKLEEKEAPRSLFGIKELTLSGVENLFLLLSREKYTNIAAIRDGLYKIYLTTIEKNWDEKVVSWSEFESLSLDEYRELIYDEVNTLQLLGGNAYDIKVKNAVHYILWNYACPDLSIKTIADHVNLSQNYLSTLFKKETGLTINDFLLNIRAEKACRLLGRTDLKLYEIAEKIGLQDPNYLSTVFKKRYGITPTQYRKTMAILPEKEGSHEANSQS